MEETLVEVGLEILEVVAIFEMVDAGEGNTPLETTTRILEERLGFFLTFLFCHPPKQTGWIWLY